MQCGLPTLDRMVQTTMRNGCGAAPKNGACTSLV